MSIDNTKPLFTITEAAALKVFEFIQEEREIICEKSNYFLAEQPLDNNQAYFPFAFQWSLWLLEEMDIKLKISILGGGCHGFRYNFSFTHITQPTDMVITKMMSIPHQSKPITVECIIDVISLQFLRGGELDYQSDLQGERFIIRNLKAKTTCGCGSSFGV